MALQSMFPPSTTKPDSQYASQTNLGARKTGFGPFHGALVVMLKDNFSITTWLALGGVLQLLLTLVLPRSAAAFPAVALIAWGIIDVVLTVSGLKEDKNMRNIILDKFTVAYPKPGEESVAGSKPGENGPGAVMILSTRSNSALGMFEPGFKEVGDRFRDMLKQLEAEKETNGFMGMSTWMANERGSGNELSTISYWRSVDDVHKFAASPIHRDTIKWWDASKLTKIGIMHELFEIPKTGGWEGIYVNYHPAGLAATTKPVYTGNEKNSVPQKWVSPIVTASFGRYRTSRGRMGRKDPEE